MAYRLAVGVHVVEPVAVVVVVVVAVEDLVDVEWYPQFEDPGFGCTGC